MSDLYTQLHEGIVGVHRAIRDAFSPVAAGSKTSLDVLVPQARGAASFLLAHHEMENTCLFPGLRKYGRLRSSDAAFLDTCDREHHELHTICERLISAITAPHPDASVIASLASETVVLLDAHTRHEETGLTAENLQQMIDETSFATLCRELEDQRAKNQARVGSS